ncbi:thioester domain-containing protein, partial [Corynebacterium sp. CCM 9203]|uniref:thioester domain-containing protein n=1 Tax=Corynebacterium sp. CCM 9203 TaxID=3057615 RepID=UPI0035264060
MNAPLGVTRNSIYQPSTFEAEGIPNAGKVRWILNHAYYDVISGAALSTAAGINTNNRDILVTGTQAAIWHFTNDITVESWGPNGTAVKAVFDYLVDSAKDIPAPEYPVVISPGLKTGESGSDVGPFSVSSTDSNATLALIGAPAGLTMVNANGDDLGRQTSLSGIQEVFVRVPADQIPGTAQLRLSGSGDLPAGAILKDMGSRGTSVGTGQQLGVARSTGPYDQEILAAVEWTEP